MTEPKKKKDRRGTEKHSLYLRGRRAGRKGSRGGRQKDGMDCVLQEKILKKEHERWIA